MIKFNDGVEFNTQGSYRIEERVDGFYVVGEGWLIPVTNSIEGNKIIGIMKEKDDGIL